MTNNHLLLEPPISRSPFEEWLTPGFGTSMKIVCGFDRRSEIGRSRLVGFSKGHIAGRRHGTARISGKL